MAFSVDTSGLPGALLQGNALFALVIFGIAVVIGILLIGIGVSARSPSTRMAGAAFLVIALVMFIVSLVLATVTF